MAATEKRIFYEVNEREWNVFHKLCALPPDSTTYERFLLSENGVIHITKAAKSNAVGRHNERERKSRAKSYEKEAK